MIIQYNTEYGQFKQRIDKMKTKEYSVFDSMKTRCNSDNSAYSEIKIDKRFEDFQAFAEWCHKQVGFGLTDYHLDKDILVDGNKIYTPELCVFVPYQINNLIIRKQKRKTNLPCGVRFTNKKYKAEISIDSHEISLGYYLTVDEALNVYVSAKLAEVHRKATQYKEVVDKRVYDKLISYNFEYLKKICLSDKFDSNSIIMQYK